MSPATVPCRCCAKRSRRCLPRRRRDYAERDAAVFVDQGKRFTWGELRDTVDALAAGLLSAGPRKRRPHRHLVAEPLGMAGDAVRHRPHRPGPGQHQSGLPAGRARICAEQGRLQGAGHRRANSRPPTISACSRRWRRSSRRASRASSMRAKLPHLKIVIRMGEEQTPGMFNFDDVLAMGGATSATARRDLRRPAARTMPINIQFTSRHDRRAEGRDADPLQHRQQRAISSPRRCSFTADDRLCIPVPLYHCFGMVMGTLGCVTQGRDHGISRARASIPARRCARWQAERCTGALRRADHVRRHARPSRVRALRPVVSLRTGIMAGAPCPIEVMKKVVVADAHGAR